MSGPYVDEFEYGFVIMLFRSSQKSSVHQALKSDAHGIRSMLIQRLKVTDRIVQFDKTDGVT